MLPPIRPTLQPMLALAPPDDVPQGGAPALPDVVKAPPGPADLDSASDPSGGRAGPCVSQGTAPAQHGEAAIASSGSA